jgi:3-phenylpropionate/cinnamic acid dioxygenase small subunit
MHRAGSAVTPLPYTDVRALAAWQFLVEEAALLDAHRYADWLDLMTDDVSYEMPVAVTLTRANAAAGGGRGAMDHFHEDLFSLRKRVDRIATQHAWTEDPVSRVRHFVTNVRVFERSTEDELAAESYVLMYRSRGDVNQPSIVSAGRRDVLRRVDGALRLAQRLIEVDEAVLRTQNLAVFL